MRRPRRFTTMQLAFWEAGMSPGRPKGPRPGWQIIRRDADGNIIRKPRR